MQLFCRGLHSCNNFISSERDQIMNNRKKTGIRTLLMLVGIFLISISVACFRLAAFGVDAFTGMNLGISGFLNWSFGNWQLLANIAILVVVFFTVRHCIGAGTVINMVCVGYVADFTVWLVEDALKIEMGLPVRLAVMVLALLSASLGVAFYMTADMGLSPYDSVALIIEKLTEKKIPFHIARIVSDVTALAIGSAFCVASGNSIWTVIGLATVCNALFNGPMIRFFKKRVDKLYGSL